MICARCGQDNPDGFRFCGACGAPLTPATAPREVRKVVTVLFCDVTGSTAMGERLDPESTRRVMTRYFDEMRTRIERHGGSVEKFIGDAVMAVFGVPVVHEDDALRAVRAAVDMRAALAELNEELERDLGVRIESRIGINTGEVVVGEGDSLAVGDAVNVAARLEQGAAPGETLLGEATYRLVRGAVVTEPAEALQAKGKSEPVPAHRLIRTVAGADFIARRLDSPLVGRDNELAQLQRAYERAVAERVPYLFTLLGAAGIGKSRLVRELDERVNARVLAGRCLPYGEGITYWPLLEIEPLAAAVDFAANRGEIALQTRRTLEALAREQPLVVVFDDLQWAEPTFLDLVDHVTDLARDAPMLVVCVARPELLDVRPGWGGGKLNATTMLLDALTEAEAARLVDNLVENRAIAELGPRIAAAAEGNPLYVEEILTMVLETGEAESIPPTIRALLAARLDRLAPEERAVLECAAIEGQEFRADALRALLAAAAADAAADTLQALVRKDVIRPTGDDSFRFKHLLVRDAAYEALPKERRAELHETFGEWVAGVRPGFEEIVAYHLEQAYRYRAELGPVDDRGRDLARRTADLLATAGRRAAERLDVHATINLLERAIRLLPAGDPAALALYPELGVALAEGGDLDRALELYVAAEAGGDRPTVLRARVRRIWVEVLRGMPQNDAVAPLEEVLVEAERMADDALAAEVLWRLAVIASWIGNLDATTPLLRDAVARADAAGDPRAKAQALHWLALDLLYGRTPVELGLAESRRLSESAGLAATARVELLIVEGTLHGLAGRIDEARRLTESRQTLLELGSKVQYAAIAMPIAVIELVAGDVAAAEQMLVEARDLLAAAGERGYLSTVSALLALTMAKQARFAEAAEIAEESRQLGAPDDVITQIYWRVAKAHADAARGDAAAAAALAAEAVELAESYESFDGPIAIVEIADYLEPDARVDALERALAGATAKGNVVTAAQARELLEALP